MKRATLCNLLIAAAASATIVPLTAMHAGAAGVNGHYVDDPRCDVLPDQQLTRELGDVAMFPASDAIAYHDHRLTGAVGVPDDGIANDWTVHMTNLSGQAWKNVFFVADAGATIGNADGRVDDLLGAPGVMSDAFRIDAFGVNANLLSESISADGIFQPGEDWEFAVTNFGTGPNSIPPTLVTPGIFSGSSPLGSTQGNASILGVPVPEPTTVTGIAFIAMTYLARRRPRR